MWIDSRKVAWTCNRVNTPPAFRRASKMQGGVRYPHPFDTESYCLIRQMCSPPFHSPVISFPLHQWLWYLECVSTYEGFLIWFCAGFISKAHCYFAPMMGNTLALLPCLTLSFFHSPADCHDKEKWTCLLFCVFIPLQRKCPLFAFIKHQF